MGQEIPTLINVCGAGRSGTTMLGLMLGNAPDAFSCGEVYALFRPWRLHHFQPLCACGKDPCPYWEKLRTCPEHVFHREVLHRLNVSYVIDSSKPISWVLDNNDWAAQCGIGVANLLVWKDPIGLAYSHWKRGEGIHAWRSVFVKYYARFFQARLPFVAVSYNQLVKDPPTKLRQICGAVGMEYFPGKERFWEKEHHHLFGSGGVRRQVRSRESKIRSTESFPSQFLRQTDELSQEIERDREVQTILRRLTELEVSLNDHNMVRVYDRGTSPPTRRPVWYYWDWLKRRYRRRVPRPFP